MASSRAIRAARAFVEITGEDSKLRKVFAGVKSRMKSLAIGAAAVGTAGLAVAGAAAAGAVASVFKFAAAGDQLDKMSSRTGATSEALSQLGFAAEQSGTDLATVERSMQAMSRQMLQAERGSAEITKTLDELGLSVGNLSGLSPDQQMEVFADALSRVEDPGRKAALAMQIFGKSGTQMLPLLNGGAEGIRGLREEADQLGLTISTDQAKAAADFTDAWNRIKRAVGAAFIQVGAKLAPVMTDLAGRVLPWVVSGGRAVATIMEAVGVGFITALDAASTGIRYLLDSFPNLTSAVTETFGGIMDALSSGDYALAARILWLSLKLAWAEGVDAISQEWAIWSKAFRDTFNDAITYVLKQWHKLQNILSKAIIDVVAFLGADIDADEVNAELDQMLKQQLATVDREAEANQAARDRQFESDISKTNADLEAARAEWAEAVAAARNQAEVAANEPSAASTAENKFNQLLESMKAGEIATRIDNAVKAPSSVGDLRTTSGAGQLVSILNRTGTIEMKMAKALAQIAESNAAILTLTRNGPKAIKI